MINIRKGYVLCKEHNISYSKDSCCKECEKINCLLCNQTVNKLHKNILIILIKILL